MRGKSNRSQMGKVICILSILFVLNGCGVADQRNEAEQSFAVIEVESASFEKSPSQLVLINEMPCALVDGEAYVYEDGIWKLFACEQRLERLYSGEMFCGVTVDGKLVAETEKVGEECMPLGSAGSYSNGEELLKQAAGEKIREIGSEIYGGQVLVAFADGEVALFVQGKAHAVTDELEIAEVSGKYLLTTSGEVYHATYKEHTEEVSLEKISAEEIISISAAPTASRCIGITKEGKIESWSDLGQELAADAQHAEKICMGYDYCVAIQQGGEVYFAAYDKELEQEVREYLEDFSQKAIHITCAYRRIVILFEDNSMKVIDL